MRFILVNSILLLSLIFLSGCNDTKSEAKVIKVHKEPTTTTFDTSIIDTLFKKEKKLSTNNQKILLLFGASEDIYTQKLQNDIANSIDLQNKIKNEFSSYYINANDNLQYQIAHDNTFVDVDTKTLIAIYGIRATPSIIFTDNAGKAVLLVPGYIPTEQLLATMDFMNTNLWQNKDRKNGEVYEALKAYYKEHNININ